MNYPNSITKRTLLATAITTAIGATTLPNLSQAASLEFSVSGWFTMVNGLNRPVKNPDADFAPMYANRTPIAGTLTIDTADNSGTVTLNSFSFFGGGAASATTISFSAIGDGSGGPGTLALGNMGFNWSGNNGIPVSIVWDSEGLLEAINAGIQVLDTLGPAGSTFVCNTDINCADPASDTFTFGKTKSPYTLPMGAGPVVTTTWDTTNVNTGAPITLGDNPSGTLPLIPNGIGGSPMQAGPFPDFNANFDFTSMTLLSDGSGSIDAPAPVNDSVPENPGPPKQQSVNLGVPANVTPAGTAEYCLTGISDCDANGWTANLNTGANNPVNVPITETINTQTVDWRSGGGIAFAIQTVTATVADTIPPVLDSTPLDVNVNVTSTSEDVCFTNDTIGRLTASDIWDANPAILYSLNGFDFSPSDPVEDCSDQFGANANTVFWRAVDTAGNITPYEQTVTLNLPGGIIGKACELNLDYDGLRLLAGNFIMRGPTGAQIGITDNTVTGDINTTLRCTEQGTDICPDVGATLETKQPFEGLLWKAEPVWLYGPGDWTFEACPGDNSGNCTGPAPLSMTVLDAAANGGIPQLGAHMLFAWGSTSSIDVVVVWNVDCGTNQLTTTDPGGDGILGTPMVDGPFIGFNAAFDESATGIDAGGGQVPLIADGGFLTDIPAYKNPVAGTSPLPLDADKMNANDFPKDSKVAESCVGGCYDFETDGLIDGTDANGDYQYVQVTLPLDEAIPFWSQYRKFDTASQTWGPFVVDDRNSVKTALKDDAGFCPEPGTGSYKAASFNTQLAEKLEADDNCVELTIEKDGPNDSIKGDDMVTDPSGVAKIPAPKRLDAKTTDSGAGGGCSLASNPVEASQRGEWWLLGGLLAWMGWSRRKRKQH